MTAPTLEGRLLCASNVAYDVLEDGAVRTRPPYYEGTGFIEAPAGLCRGPKVIDAAFVGRTADGVILALSVSPARPERIAFVDQKGNFYRSDDGGATWASK